MHTPIHVIAFAIFLLHNKLHCPRTTKNMDKSIKATKGSNGNTPSSIADPQGQPELISGIHVNKDQARVNS